ncbi:Mesoderm induction early response protein 3, partial [Ophiophagus hannah]
MAHDIGSLSSEDHDFDPTAEMLVHDYDDERTLEEEEMMDEGKNFSSEIEDLEKEGSMPLEDLLAFYGYESTIPVIASSSADSSPSELADELPDMTLDKEEIAKDLLSGDDEETQSSADDLTPSVTSHETTDFFPRPLRSNTTCDGDKESDGEDVEVDTGNSSEDLRKVRTRTVAECVAFYYMWKKSERYDYFAQQTRFGKKRYNHHPGVTDYMDRLVDEAEALGGAVSSAIMSNNRLEPIPDQQLSLLNSITANDLTALTNSVATVCHSTDVNSEDAFPPLDSLPRTAVNHVPVVTEDLLNLPSNGESDCFNLFETGFYHSELNTMNMCGEESERPAKRLKMGIAVPESFMNEVSVNNLAVDFENHTHHITSAKMAVSVADFSSLSANETNGFISAHALHQHTALHSE